MGEKTVVVSGARCATCGEVIQTNGYDLGMLAAVPVGLELAPARTYVFGNGFGDQPERQARWLARSALTAWGLGHLVDTAESIVAEVVMNARVHGGGVHQVAVRYDVAEELVRMEVWDTGTGADPIVRASGGDDEDGRGMLIVEVLATRWGVYQDSGQRVVFAELAVPVSRLTPCSDETLDPWMNGGSLLSSAAVAKTLRELPIDFTFTDDEHQRFQQALLTLQQSPYTAYEKFTKEIQALIKTGEVPQRFVAFCETQKLLERVHSPFLSIANCPIDLELQIWDNDDPVNDKRRRKATFIAEGFLQTYAVLMDQPVLAYINVNEGDRFQDIYPKEDMKETQSQKAIVPLYFHKDLANHFVSPDYVNMLSMRAHPDNETYTTFVCNAEALARLDDKTKAVLREVEFYTPFDDLTVMSGSVELGKADDHPILSGDYDFRYFENRTVGTTDRAQRAVDTLNQALHDVKRRVHMMPGDFISIYNHFSVHSKELHNIADPDALRHRWIIKTVNVDDLATHEQHYLPGSYGVVNG